MGLAWKTHGCIKPMQSHRSQYKFFYRREIFLQPEIHFENTTEITICEYDIKKTIERSQNVLVSILFFL